jgi:hypothetical protein
VQATVTTAPHSDATPSGYTADPSPAVAPDATRTSVELTPSTTTLVGPSEVVQVRLINPPSGGHGGIWILLEPMSSDTGVEFTGTELDFVFTTHTSMEEDATEYGDGVWSQNLQIGDPDAPNHCASVTSEEVIVLLVSAAEDAALDKAADAAYAADPNSPEYGTTLPPGDTLARVKLERNGHC